MQRNDFVTKDVVSGSDIRRYCDSPRVVVGNQLVGSPSTWDGSIIDEANAVDLEELESGLIDCFAVAIAVGEIIDNWAVVGRLLGDPGVSTPSFV